MSADATAPASRLRGARVLAVLAFVVVSAVIAWRTAHNAIVPGHPELSNPGQHDFRDVLYYPARAVLDGRNPYDASTFLDAYPVARSFAPYAPTTLLLHLPFALLPFTIAAWTHFTLNALLVLALAWLCLHACGLRAGAASTFGLGALILLGRPAHMTLYIGQCAVYIALACDVALIYGRTRPWLAGVGLAIACVKPTFGIPLALVMLVRRELRALAWAALIGGVSSAAILALLVSAAHGIAPLLASLRDSYARLLLDPSASATSSIIRLDTIALVTRLVGRGLGGGVELAITAGILLVGLATIVAIERTRLDGPRLLSSTVATCMMLTCTYHQAYDAVLLVFPAVALASDQPEMVAAFGRTRWLLLALLCVPALNYASTDTLVDALGVEGAAWKIVTSLNGAALLGAFLFMVVGARRLARPAPTPLGSLRSESVSS